MTTVTPMEIDRLLDEATLPETTESVCLNGKLVREYEAMSRRIAERAEQRAKDAQAGAPADVRLSSRPAKKFVDPEAADLERLRQECKRYTVEFTLRAMDVQPWNDLFAAHPPRKDPKTGALDPRDTAGVNAATFYLALLRVSIVSPEMTDARFDKLMSKLTDAQFDRLSLAAFLLNRAERNIPF